MHSPFHPVTDPELAANADVIAAAVLSHPASLLIGSRAVHVLTGIAERDRPSLTAFERRLLRGALLFLDAAEIHLGREAGGGRA